MSYGYCIPGLARDILIARGLPFREAQAVADALNAHLDEPGCTWVETATGRTFERVPETGESAGGPTKSCFNCRWRDAGAPESRKRCFRCWDKPDRPGWEPA